MSLNRREFIKVAALTAAGITLAACRGDVTAIFTPTPFTDNKPSFSPTPQPADLKAAIWLAAYNKFLNKETIELLTSLDETVNDLRVRYHVAEGIIENSLNSRPGGPIERRDILRKAGRVIGVDLCGDARVICDTVMYSSDAGKVVPELATIEARPLGAAPRVFPEGVNISLSVAHCNSAGDLSGCGALQAMAKLMEPGGADFLEHHGIDKSTIAEIQRTLKSANPREQAVIGAKIQAMINTANHGGKPHTAVAVLYGHADNSFEILGAFDNLGNSVEIPQVVKDYIAYNNTGPRIIGRIDEALARKQTPFQYVFDATRHNTQDLLGSTAATKDQVFKIKVTPQSGNLDRAINLAEVDKGIAALAYPQSHNWGQLQWVLAHRQEELDLIHSRLLASENTWKFLGNDGVIVEALVEQNGAFSGNIRITRMDQMSVEVKKAMTARRAGLITSEITLSAKTFWEAERTLSFGQREGRAATGVIDRLKNLGRFSLKILDKLQPIFIAMSVYEATLKIKELLGQSLIYDSHALRFSTVRPMDATQYDKLLKENPRVEPYLAAAGMYDTTLHPYTPRELADSFEGLLTDFMSDVNNYNHSDRTRKKYTITDRRSDYAGLDIDNLAKILNLDFTDIHDDKKHKVLVKSGAPLVFFPIPPENPPSDKPWLVDANLQEQQYIILNTETKEFLVTGVEGSMIVPMVIQEPREGMKKTVYYIHLHMDKDGNMIAKNVGYDENGNAKSMIPGITNIAALSQDRRIPPGQAFSPADDLSYLQSHIYDTGGGAGGLMGDNIVTRLNRERYSSGEVSVPEQVIFES